MSTPTALHSGQSAMALLHTVPPACLITGRDRPGEWAEIRYCMTYNDIYYVKIMGATHERKVTVEFCRVLFFLS